MKDKVLFLKPSPRMASYKHRSVLFTPALMSGPCLWMTMLCNYSRISRDKQDRGKVELGLYYLQHDTISVISASVLGRGQTAVTRLVSVLSRHQPIRAK